jgi:hypothetical protein
VRPVRCRRYYRYCPDQISDAGGKIIGPAYVAGKDRDNVPSAVVNNDHGRICHFIFQVRRDIPHRDPARTDKYKGIASFKKPTHIGAYALV